MGLGVSPPKQQARLEVFTNALQYNNNIAFFPKQVGVG